MSSIFGFLFPKVIRCEQRLDSAIAAHEEASHDATCAVESAKKTFDETRILAEKRKGSGEHRSIISNKVCLTCKFYEHGTCTLCCKAILTTAENTCDFWSGWV